MIILIQSVDENQNILWHFFWIVLPVMLTVMGSQWLSQRANRKRGEEKDRKRFLMDLEKDNRLAILLENYRLHEHVEKDATLHSDGIRYPREISRQD